MHLWLGLGTGLLIVFVCLTGSILAFEQEIEQAWHPARYFVAPATTPRLPLAQLAEAMQACKPKARIGSFKLYAGTPRTVEVSLAGKGRRQLTGSAQHFPAQLYNKYADYQQKKHPHETCAAPQRHACPQQRAQHVARGHGQRDMV